MAWIQQDCKGFRRIGTRISARHPNPLLVMPGLVPGIHFHRFRCTAAWMPGTSPGMTEGGDRAVGVESVMGSGQRPRV